MKYSMPAIVGAVLAASMSFTGIARADSANGAFYYQYLGPYTTLSLGSAPSTAPVVTPDATFTASSNALGTLFNFQLTGTGVAGDWDLYNFVTYGGDTVTGINGTSGAGTDNINNGVFVFTGSEALTTGVTYEITHDDGMILYLNNGSGWFTAINAPGATASEISDFMVPTTGTYSYELIYAEVNGGPAVLTSDNFGVTPEPSTLVLLGTGLLGMAFALFRRNKTAGLALR
jgi:hypothetical protein